MKTRGEIIDLLRAELPNCEQLGDGVQDGASLEEMGIGSMQLLTAILSVHRKYGLDLERIVERGAPVTVGELVELLRESVSY